MCVFFSNVSFFKCFEKSYFSASLFCDRMFYDASFPFEIVSFEPFWYVKF